MKRIMIVMLFLVFPNRQRQQSFLFTGYLVYFIFFNFIVIIKKYLLKAIIRIGY